MAEAEAETEPADLEPPPGGGRLTVPKLALVLLVGPSGAGKSTFARQHFLPTEVVSSDACRGMVCDNENDQSVTPEAFGLLHEIAGRRLALGKLTVIDATNVQVEARAPLVALARRFHALAVAIVLDPPESVCHAHNQSRPDRAFGPHVVRNQKSQLRRGMRGLRREGFKHVYVLRTPEEAAAARLERVPLWTDKTAERGPFDFIGDVHGCADELEALLALLGYTRGQAPAEPGWTDAQFSHPEGRRAVFVGDFVSRGPRSLDVLGIVRNMVRAGTALCVPGNHDVKLLHKLRGKNVRITHGLQATVEELEALPADIRPGFEAAAAAFLDSLVSHYVLDGGKIVVAHAGMKQELQGRASGKVREFALYGETTGETDELGLPVRGDWAAEYRGPAMVVYGHTPVWRPEWVNRTANIDTGCVFGGQLTALRYPELEFVAVPAAREYVPPHRPFVGNAPAEGGATGQQAADDMLDMEDVLGKRHVATRLRGLVTIRAEHAAAALETMARFAIDPKWLIHLPATMSPCETSAVPGLLEHPAEAFAYYRAVGATQAVCEEKHMGSRAIVTVCRDAAAARERFGVAEGPAGAICTRTGRAFFKDAALEAAFLERLRAALSAADFWEKHQTAWACLDCELLPWSAKAQELLKEQYAAVGAAGRAALPPAVAALDAARASLPEAEAAKLQPTLERFRRRARDIDKFVAAYRQYCWPTDGLAGLKLAPFHLLATEGSVHLDKDHLWHLEAIAEFCRHDPELLLATPHRLVELGDEASVAAASAWWEELTARGGEGMVVKPRSFLLHGPKGLAQPAVKCRGREYLRIIYGPDYAAEENLARLRRRGLGRKRSLALAEFALGIEALERFVRREPLRRVHECVFGVLALESEPVDPRL